MNGSASNARLRKERVHAAPKVAPVTRAIRSALAASATALALTAPVASMAAGSCSYDTGSHAYARNGSFDQIIFRQIVQDASIVPPVDLTVVPADHPPTGVHLAASGIGDACTDDVPVFSHIVTGLVASGGVEGWDVGSVDDITHVDGIPAFVRDASGIYDVNTASASSLSSDISIDNRSDNAFVANHAALGIGNEGVINADSLNDGVNGVVAMAVYSSVEIDNSSDISVSGYGNVFGIDILDGYAASLHNGANISAEAGVGAGYFGTGAYATGARINSMDTSVSNSGSISATASADGYYARARGVDAFGYSVGTTVDNVGDIHASAQADGGMARATGVYSFGYASSSTVDNAGDIHANALADGGFAYATAINSIAYGYSGGRDAAVTNSGALSAEADADRAYALTVFNLARGRYANAYATNASDGEIYAEATGDYTTAEGVNNGAARYGNATASNAGGIHATANATSGARAVGIVNYSTGSIASVDNDGSIFATGTTTIGGRAFAIGIQNTSELYNANAYNAGSVSVAADGIGGAWAAGVLSTAGRSSYALNEAEGDIDVAASSWNEAAIAFGAYVSAPEVATLLNYGSISAQASGVDGVAYAYGAIVLGGSTGIGLLINGGSISAEAVTGDGAAYATGAYVTSEVATIFNDGSTAATAISGGDGSMAVATGARIYGVNSAIFSYGDLTASASAQGYGSIAVASGAYSIGTLDSSVFNGGDIHASASAAGGEASAIGVGSVGYYFDSYATNTGTGRIVADAAGNNATATGMLSASVLYGDAITTNSGSLIANAAGTSYARAVGAYNFAGYYNALIDNTGSVEVRASTNGDSSAAFAIGANAISRNGYGDATVRNAGDISATADAQGTYSMAIAYGVLAASGNYGGIDLENDGSITTNAHTDHGLVNSFAAYMLSVGGAVSMVNRGDLEASGRNEDGYAYVFGAYVSSLPYGYDSVAQTYNSGSVTANVSVGRGTAIGKGISNFGAYAYVSNTADGSIDVTADSEVSGVSGATGIFNLGTVKNGVVNDGAISAYSHASGSGLYTYSGTRAMAIYSAGGPFATTDVVNNGDLSAVAVSENAHTHFGGSSGATGIMVYAKFGDVENSGDILVSATTNAGVAGTYGIIDHGKYNSNIVNSGDVTAHAYAGSIYGDQFAARSVAMGTQIFGSRYVTEYNSGSISATAISADPYGLQYDALAFAYGAMLHANRNATLDNQGDIAAHARADNGYSSAIGVDMWGRKAGTIINAGDITAQAHADGGIAVALGVYNLSTYSSLYGTALLDNEGLIRAAAYGGVAESYAAVLLGSVAANATNTGDITSIAEGGDAHAVGLIANSNGYASLQNSGTITAQASAYGNAMASGAEITGRSESGYVSVAVLNAGDVGATAAGGASASAYGLLATTPTGNIYLVNDAYASITAQAQAGSGPAQAFGVYAAGQGTSTLSNYGSIASDASSVYGDAMAYAALVDGGYAGIGLLINGGDLSADASAAAGGNATATGAFVYADVASIFNDRSTTATSTSAGGQAVAIAAGLYGSSSAIYNYGDLTASASADGGIAMAIGADAFGYTGSSFQNVGDIGANASADGGVASATGASSIGIFGTQATNTGAISAVATGGQTSATGLYNASVFDAITVNEGSISAVADGTLAAYGQYEAMAFGAYSLALYYNSVIDNNGSISASASATTDISGTDGFLVAKALGAVAMSMHGYGETVVANSGSITTSAETSQGYAGAWGAVTMSGLYGIATIDNEGLISVYAHTDIGSADTIGAYVSTIGGASSVVNHGDISAHSRAERPIPGVSVNFSVATGVQAFSVPYGGGEVTVDNYGNIEANASILGGIGYATGVQAYAQHTSVNNAAGANVTAAVDAELFGGAWALGIDAGGMYSVDVVNDGRIAAYGHANAHSEGTVGFYGAAGATGIYAHAGAQGDAMVVNNGDITALAIAEHSIGFVQGGAGATGIHTYAKYDATVVNTSNITAIAEAEFGIAGAQGAIAGGKYSSHIVNAAGASIVASASVGSLYGDQQAGIAESFGTQVFAPIGMDQAVTYNAGSIVSHAVVTPDGTQTPIDSAATAFGSWASSGITRGTVANLGSIEAAASADFGYATAYGAFLRTGYESVITNAGDIRASAAATGGNAFAVGSYAFSLHETVTYNCDPTGYYCDYANPIVVVDGGESTLENSGAITATASAIGGMGYSYGAALLSAYAASITNAGHISAVADAGDALAIGSIARSFYGETTLHNSGVIGAKATGDIASASGVAVHGASGIQVDNSGSIVAAAYGPAATAIGASLESVGSHAVTNSGTVGAIAEGDDVLAVGVKSDGFQAIALQNTGMISASATGTTTANAFGVQLSGTGSLQFDNTGSIVATADAASAFATAVSMEAYDTRALTNSGSLGAIARGDDVRAVGVQTNGFQTPFALQNTGTISASAAGTRAAAAYGVQLSGTGSLQFDNTGSIVATADGANAFATAVSMEAGGSTKLTNTGMIAAIGDGSRVAIASGASASLAIANSGSIIGAIASGDLDDRFDNAAGASWLAVGTSNFGAGNDLLINHGTIGMDDAEVRLGAGSNAFDNFGTIVVSGDSLVEMAHPFRNNGVIEFRDGAPDDVLTIVGDFAGEGVITLDVSALHGTSDHLYVGGVVNGSTTQTIDVSLSSLPGAPTVDIPLAFVGGNIEAGKFTLGNVRYVPYDFLTVDFNLRSRAGATAAARDVLSLGIEVIGLNDTGSMATALAPGAQSLLNAQIGTWRQRMGVVPKKGGDVGVAPWLRYFTQSGDIDPSHGGNFGMGGDFGFHQSNHGWELGVDTRIGEQFAVGVLMAQSEGSQRLTDGAGSDRLDGDGYGVYGTWMANSFYLDASVRWLDLDARLRYPAGELKARTSATASNVEAGFTGWSLSGMNLVPQAQYTHTDVDDFSPLLAEQATFAHHGGTSSRGRLGVAFDKSFDASNWVLTPYGSLNAIREFDGEFAYTVNGGVNGSTSTRGTSAMVELGLGARTSGLSITGSANWTDGGAMQGVSGGQLVVRYDW